MKSLWKARWVCLEAVRHGLLVEQWPDTLMPCWTSPWCETRFSFPKLFNFNPDGYKFSSNDPLDSIEVPAVKQIMMNPYVSIVEVLKFPFTHKIRLVSRHCSPSLDERGTSQTSQTSGTLQTPLKWQQNDGFKMVSISILTENWLWNHYDMFHNRW